MGNLNAQLEGSGPRNPSELKVAELVDHLNLRCLSCHFKQQRRTHIRGRWTLGQKQRNKRRGRKRWVRWSVDYLLGSKAACWNCQNCRLVTPRHHSLDYVHRCILALLQSSHKGKLCAYKRKRQKYPLERVIGPFTETEDQYDTLRESCKNTPVWEQHANDWI